MIRLATFVTFCARAIFSIANAADVQSYRTGRTLVAGCVGSDLDFCSGYIAGVVDVFSALHAGTGNQKFQMCIPSGVTPLMLAKVVVEWIVAHDMQDQDAAGYHSLSYGSLVWSYDSSERPRNDCLPNFTSEVLSIVSIKAPMDTHPNTAFTITLFSLVERSKMCGSAEAWIDISISAPLEIEHVDVRTKTVFSIKFV